MRKSFFVFSMLLSCTIFPKMSWALPECVANEAIWDNCFGTYQWTSGDLKRDKYVGEWKDNKQHGQGTYYYLADNESKGDKFVGEFRDGKRHGQGTYFYAGGQKSEGEYKNGKMNGYNIQYNVDGSIYREGIFKDGEFLYEEKRSKNKSSSPENFEFDNYKKFCKEIGFTPGTEKFGDCVMKLMDRD